MLSKRPERQMVRITSLANFLHVVEFTANELLGTKYLYKTEEETEAFKAGMESVLRIIRKEYGIKETD